MTKDKTEVYTENLEKKTERVLACLYAKNGRAGFSYKDISAHIDKGYAPGRIDFPMEDRDRINQALEEMDRAGYVVLRKYTKEHSFTLYGGTFTKRMEDLCLQTGFMTRTRIAREERESIAGCPAPENERLAEWVDNERIECRLAKEAFSTSSEAGFPGKELQHAVMLADAVMGHRGTMYERDLAKKVLNDSKGITRKKRTFLERILVECADKELLEDYEERKAMLGTNTRILPLYGVIKTPEYIRTQGHMKILLNNGGVIETHGLPYLFSSQYIKEIEHITVMDKRIITIENLTTYEDYNEKDTVKVYTGGFPSFPTRELLEKIHKDNPEIRCLHWSDIDCGGFRIFRHIRQYLPMAEPYRMDIKDMEENKDFWTPLTENDRAAICKYKDDPFFGAVSAFMLKNNAKLEQESICIQS